MGLSIRGAIFALLAASIWGGMYVAAKYALGTIPPFTLLLTRLLMAIVLLGTANATLHGPWPRGWEALRLLAVGVIGFGISLGAQFVGTQLSTAANGALVTSTSPVFIVLFAAILLHERLTLSRLGALLLACVGVLIVIDPRQAALLPEQMLGNLALAVAAITWGLYSVLAKWAARRQPVLTVTLYAMAGGALAILPLVPWELASQPIQIPADPAVQRWLLWSVLYLGIVSTAGAMYFWNKGLELLDAGVASLFFFAQPVVGAALGSMLLGERLGSSFFWGGALIAASVLLVSWLDRKRTLSSPQPSAVDLAGGTG